MIQIEEDLRIMYAEDTGLSIVSEDEKQWYANWLEKRLIDALKNIESSSRIIESVYNDAEMRHIAVNYAITCLKGYDGNFDDWVKKISPQWREIANRHSL